jgi:hypothetical protein
MSASITVKYTLTPALFGDATSHLGRKIGGMPRWMSYLLCWVMITLTLRWLIFKESKDWPFVEQLIFAGILAGAGVGGLFWTISNQIRRNASKIETQEMTLIFSEGGLDKATLRSELKVEWKAFEKYAETDKFYFLYYSPGNVAEIVPKDAFASPGDAASFRELLTRQLAAGAPPAGSRRGFLFLLVLILAAVMMVVWTRTTFGRKSRTETRTQELPAGR